MKKLFLFIIATIITTSLYAQFGVSYHLNNAYIGINYQFNDRFLPEARFSTFENLGNIDWELNLSYIYFNNEIVDAYAGVGVTNFGSSEFISYFVAPIGLNIYPFENKAFGFLIEAAPMVGEEVILRGNAGIRFRFMTTEEEE